MARTLFLPILALLISAALLNLGNGLQFTLLPIRANGAAFDDLLIGLITSGYFVGFLLGCWLGPKMIGNVGHIRIIAAAFAALAAFMLAYPLVIDAWAWSGARLVSGFALAVAYMAIESWLNECTHDSARGTVLSVYTLIALIMLGCGQFLINLYDPWGFELFSVSAIAVALAVVPVALTRAPGPSSSPQANLRLAGLRDLPRTSVLGCIIVGLSNSAFWGFAPVFGARIGLSTGEIGAFMAVVMFGGAAFMWPVGRLSDQVDRRGVIAVVSLATAVTAMGIVFVADVSLGWLLAGGFLYGAFSMTIYPISLAHANDSAQATDFVQISGALLFVFGASSFLGPIVVAGMTQSVGPQAVFLFIATVHVAGTVLAFLFQRLRPPVAAGEKEGFHIMPRTTQEAFQLHEPDTEDAVPGAMG